MTRYRVFYEDQAAGRVNEFGPHLLLCACVADRLGGKSFHDVRQVLDGQPKKSDGKLLAACKKHAELDADELVFALFDADKLHIRLKIPKAPLGELHALLEAEIRSTKVRAFLLEDRIETLVDATAGCLEAPYRGPVPKRHYTRDKLLARAAYNTSRAIRDCITDRVPSFAALVDAVVQALR
jgi:hypothetical protein